MSGWEQVPRRELWAWTYCVVCVLWLVYNIICFLDDGEWSLLILPLLFAAFSALLTVRLRNKRRTSERNSGNNKPI